MISSRTVGAGAFVIVGGLLFTLALFMIGERKMLFKEQFPVYAEFAKLGQLEPGAIVRVAGMDAGAVSDIQIPPSPAGKFRVKMDIREDLHGLVRTDSVAIAQTDGLVGAVFVNIQSGSEAAPKVQSGGTIGSREPFSIADLLEEASSTVKMVSDTVAGLRGDIEKAVQQVAMTAEDAHGLLKDIRPDLTAMARNGKAITDDAELLIADMRGGKGTLGKFINDPALYDQAKKTIDEAQLTMTNMREVSDEARRAILDFRAKDSPAQGLIADMRVTVGQARSAVADLAENMEALKHNFLVKGFFNKRGYFTLDDISASDYRKGLLEVGNRKAMRIWLSSPVMFETRPDGTEALTDSGKTRLDNAIATYLKYLPGNPVVVEGYASAGGTSEQFLKSRQRAGMVRDFLLTRYQLSPQNTGYIALGNDVQGNPDGSAAWDGVAIAFFADPATLKLQSKGEEVRGKPAKEEKALPTPAAARVP